jgi:hypothetical protein
MEEMSTIKDDMQFILDKKNTPMRMKEKIDASFSIISGENNLNNSLMNSSSVLNNSYVRNNDNNICSYNLNEKMEKITKFQEFLNGFNCNKNILLLIDGKSIIWEIIKRTDLDITRLSNEEYITSCCSIINKEKNENKILDEKLLNIEIKGDEEKSFIGSSLDMSKVSDMNISQLIGGGDININESMEI